MINYEQLTGAEIVAAMIKDRMCLVVETKCAFLHPRVDADPAQLRELVDPAAAQEAVNSGKLHLVPDDVMVNMSSSNGARKFYGA